jgi:UDP-glucose 4-epimerase
MGVVSMRILITGGTGFIGSHLAGALLNDGNKVWVLDNLSTGRISNIAHLQGMPGFSFIYGSVTDKVLMSYLVDKCQVIVHLAAAVGVKLIVRKPIESILTNIQGTEIVLELAARKKPKVLIASSSEVYGKNAKVPFKENDDLILGSTTKSRWSYACSKAIDEFLALAYHRECGLPVVIMRFFNTVGPRQTGNYGMVLPTFVRQALEGKPITIFGDGEQTRTFTYVENVVQGITGLMYSDKAVGQVFNVGGIEEISIHELAVRVKQLTDSPSPIVRLSYSEAYGAGFEDLRRRVPDISKLKQLTGFDPNTDIDTMILRVAEYQLALMNKDARRYMAKLNNVPADLVDRAFQQQLIYNAQI